MLSIKILYYFFSNLKKKKLNTKTHEFSHPV